MWPENEKTVWLFLECATQWRYGALGGVIGLDYSALDVMFRYRNMEVTPELFEGVQVMERAALPVLNAKESK